jgi:hypothetical protein
MQSAPNGSLEKPKVFLARNGLVCCIICTFSTGYQTQSKPELKEGDALVLSGLLLFLDRILINAKFCCEAKDGLSTRGMRYD